MRSLSHLFDGIHAHSKIANFQLVDVSDPLLSTLIRSTKGVLGACSSDPNEGWYAHDYLEQIRQILRRKWLGALEAMPVSNEDCADLLNVSLSAKSRLGAAGSAQSAPAKVASAAMRAKAEGRLTRTEKDKILSSTGARRKGKGKGKARAASGTESDASETPSGSGSGAGSGVDGDDGEAQAGEAEQTMRDDDVDEYEDAARDSDGRAGGSDVPSSRGGSGSPAPRGRSASGSTAPVGGVAPVAKAPWELPRKKRTKAKAAETEADLVRPPLPSSRSLSPPCLSLRPLLFSRLAPSSARSLADGLSYCLPAACAPQPADEEEELALAGPVEYAGAGAGRPPLSSRSSLLAVCISQDEQSCRLCERAVHDALERGERIRKAAHAVRRATDVGVDESPGKTRRAKRGSSNRQSLARRA